ncbi:MAG: UDP-N-acetylmuramate--L-alanine ligase, partial [Proteobacteria bacterium]|nr:UDP-N-acetylmuramate--L-alanine ligase [Pseudomonadota bacterium]
MGELTKEYFTIAVSGTHGKSTTTSMLSLVLIKAGIDPTVIVGTKLKEFGNSNFRKGNSKYLVIEADEWSASFLSYWPQIIILTNIEREHLDYYKDLNHILKTFKEYIGHLPKYGLIVANKDNENITKLLKNSSFK